MSNNRLEILKHTLIQNHLDAFLISDPFAISYYYDIEFDPNERIWLMIVQPDQQPILIANELFVFEQPEGTKVHWIKDGDSIVDCLESSGFLSSSSPSLTIGVDKSMIAGWLMPLMEAFPQITWQLAGDIVDNQRAIKSSEELTALKEVANITDRSIARLIEEVIPYGPSEIEACEALKKIFVEEGANGGLSFEPIIAYGANGADPHHVPDHTLPHLGDSIIIDVGCRHNFYCSDMTRTVYYEQPSQEALTIYQTVKRAQELGFEAVSVDQPLSQVDLAGRNYISQAGYGQYFTHRIGHFIGRQCHEKGDVSSVNDQLIQNGNAFSIEPGIYLPGNTAVRIEDIFIVHDGKAERLNNYSHELQIISPKK